MSSLPWETPALIRSNLRVIAKLKPFQKLSVLKQGAGHDAERWNDLGKDGRGLRTHFKRSTFSSGSRSKKGETITDRDAYLWPLRVFFSQACQLYRKVRVDPEGGNARAEEIGKEISAAVKGIRTLRKTYFRQYGAGQHREAAQELLDTIEAEVRGVVHAWAEVPEELRGARIPRAREWWDDIPEEQRGDPSLKHVKWLLEAYHSPTREARARLGMTNEKKVFLRYAIYVGTKGWLDRNGALDNPEAEDGGFCYEHVERLHEDAKKLLCKSLRTDPSNLDTRIRFFFGASVRWLEVEDQTDLKNNALLYMEESHRHRAKLIFEGGRVYRLNYTTAWTAHRDDEEEEIRVSKVKVDTGAQDIGELVGVKSRYGWERWVSLQASFVVDHKRDFYLTQHISGAVAQPMGRLGIKHSSYFAGGRVLFAGGMTITDGEVKTVSNDSGHYKPSREQMLHCLEALLYHGVPLGDVRVLDMALLPHKYKALDYLRYRGLMSQVPSSHRLETQ